MTIVLREMTRDAADAILAGERPGGVRVADDYPTEFSAGVARCVGAVGQFGPYFVQRPEDDLLVGEIGGAFVDEEGTIEIGYAVVESQWNRGYATAAVDALVTKAREASEVRRIVAHTPLDRPESGRVLEKAGFAMVRELDDADEDGNVVRVKEWELAVSSPSSLDFYDAELRAHHEYLRAAYGISAGDEVVDIGCGTGLTTREAARAAAPGRVLGVDVSERMLERARQLTAAERIDNVRYELGNAQVHRFDPAGFDVAISRFGTMFFADPAAAFANIAAALRPGARLVLLVWQRREDNAWMQAIDVALGDAARSPQPGADAFSLGDPDATAGILEGAGFDGIHFEDVREPVLYGHDVDAALAIVKGFQDTGAALASLSDGEAARTVERLRELLAGHYSDERGVALDSRSWLITARRCR